MYWKGDGNEQAREVACLTAIWVEDYDFENMRWSTLKVYNVVFIHAKCILGIGNSKCNSIVCRGFRVYQDSRAK